MNDIESDTVSAINCKSVPGFSNHNGLGVHCAQHDFIVVHNSSVVPRRQLEVRATLMITISFRKPSKARSRPMTRFQQSRSQVLTNFRRGAHRRSCDDMVFHTLAP